MKAVVYKGPGVISVEEHPEPVMISPHEAIVKVTAAGICGTDLHLLHGMLPMKRGGIIGHEYTGIVVETGTDVTAVKPGERVVGAAGVWCGSCEACKKNIIMACSAGAIYGCGPLMGGLNGAQAEYIRVLYADHTLYKIPPNLSDEQVILVGDVLSTAYTALAGVNASQKGVQAGDYLVIFGAGPVGLCAAAAAKLFNPAKVIVVDKVPYRLELAKAVGADEILNADTEDYLQGIRNLTNERGADYIIETTGVPQIFDDAVGAVACGGSLSVVGIYNCSVELPLQFYLYKNISVSMGLTNLKNADTLIKHVAAENLDLLPLITHKLPLNEAAKGYRIFEEKEDGAVKVLLYP